VQGCAFLLIYFIKQKSLTKTKHKMEQTNNMTAATTAKRPQFLTVLCILTFIGAGFGLLMGLWHLMTAGETQAAAAMLNGMADSASSEMGDMPGMESMNSLMDGAMKAAKYAYVLAGVEIVTNLLCLLGAVMMWKQKKTGYFLYVAGQLTAIILPIVLVGFGGIFGGIMILMAIFPIAFIIMYGLNLKHMN
jgi:hypothetical protein